MKVVKVFFVFVCVIAFGGISNAQNAVPISVSPTEFAVAQAELLVLQAAVYGYFTPLDDAPMPYWEVNIGWPISVERSATFAPSNGANRPAPGGIYNVISNVTLHGTPRVQIYNEHKGWMDMERLYHTSNRVMFVLNPAIWDGYEMWLVVTTSAGEQTDTIQLFPSNNDPSLYVCAVNGLNPPKLFLKDGTNGIPSRIVDWIATPELGPCQGTSVTRGHKVIFEGSGFGLNGTSSSSVNMTLSGINVPGVYLKDIWSHWDVNVTIPLNIPLGLNNGVITVNGFTFPFQLSVTN